MSPAALLVLCCACFLLPEVAPKTSLRVIGGQDATPGEYPFAVMILGFFNTYSTNKNTSYWFKTCSGSALSSTWTLTALHCIPKYFNYSKQLPNGVEENKFWIKYGDPHLRPSEHNNWAAILKYETIGSDDYETNGFHTHHYIDICLVYTEPVLINTYAVISALDYRSLYGSEVTMMGFGKMRGSDKPNDLKFPLELNKPLQVMKAMLRSCTEEKLLTATICAVPLCGKDRIAYRGDSGGGVMHSTGIIGVFSAIKDHYDTECIKRTLKPHVMSVTPVSPYLDWIYSLVSREERLQK